MKVDCAIKMNGKQSPTLIVIWEYNEQLTFNSLKLHSTHLGDKTLISTLLEIRSCYFGYIIFKLLDEMFCS